MLQMHPRYGLWHAWRCALVLPTLCAQDARDLAAARPAATDLCLSCEDQPCLTACPVQAFSATGYDVDSCAGFLHSADGADCMQAGCQARRACPVGVEYRYVPEHASFHMAAFAARRATRST